MDLLLTAHMIQNNILELSILFCVQSSIIQETPQNQDNCLKGVLDKNLESTPLPSLKADPISEYFQYIFYMSDTLNRS
jgi:hypothetical protein